jgi:hypothetical protein
MEHRMNISELRRIITAICPNSEIEWDNENQIIIYTGLTDDNNGELREMEYINTQTDIEK